MHPVWNDDVVDLEYDEKVGPLQFKKVIFLELDVDVYLWTTVVQ